VTPRHALRHFPTTLAQLATVHPISWFQAVALGLLQGVTELFPVSSLGHTVLFPSLFGWIRWSGSSRDRSPPGWPSW